jgi:hypothetical protein
VKKALPTFLRAIAVLTVVSGLVQIVAPAPILSFLHGEVSPTSAHFFRIIGMFMALFGGLLLQALRSGLGSRLAVNWCGYQKLGAFAAVSWAVAAKLMVPLALGVAGFDLLSGIAILAYAHSLGS